MYSSYSNLRCQKYKSILVVALSRKRKRNAFSDGLYNDLISVLKKSSIDPSITVLLLTGDGSYFSSGADLTDPVNNFKPDEDGITSRNTLGRPAGQFMMEVLKYPKVLVAAVNGPAVGIGVTLLLHCDLVYLSSKATLWAPFTRLALVPELCSSVTFMERCGMSKANELLLLGSKIDARTAEKWNLCSYVVDDSEDFIDDPFHAQNIASKVCRMIAEKLLSLPLADDTARVRLFKPLDIYISPSTELTFNYTLCRCSFR